MIKEKNPVFCLTDIPKVMRDYVNWPISSALMTRWFSSDAYQLDHQIKSGIIPVRSISHSLIDEKLVTMQWAMRFKRVSEAADTLRMTWASPNGIARLQKLVRTQGVTRLNTKWKFGDPKSPVRFLEDTCQINIKVVGELRDPFDDFYGAMGKATLKLAVFGDVESNAKEAKHVLTITHLGMYLKDYYDFNDDGSASQALGYWGYTGVDKFSLLSSDVSLTREYSGDKVEELEKERYKVRNKDFRLYRDATKKGGDFVVFSDLHLITLEKPIEYVISL